MNKVILIGRLTKDPELKFAPNTGIAIARFTVAVNRQKKKDEADFINCVAFGKAAETITQYLVKGKQIAITGSIRNGSYTAQDGSKRYTTDVVLESFEFIGNNGGGENHGKSDGDNVFEDSVFGDGGIEPTDMGDSPF